MKPFWTHSDGQTALYRFHLLEKNYTIKVLDDPFSGTRILEIKSEWNGGKSFAQVVQPGKEYDRIEAAFLKAKDAKDT